MLFNNSLWYNSSDGDFFNNYSEDHITEETRIKPVTIAIVIISSLGLLSNATCCIVIALLCSAPLSARLRFILSLCAADMLVSITSLVNVFRLALGSYFCSTCLTFDDCAKIGLDSLRISAHLTSLLNMAGLGVDHYWAIIDPLSHQCNIPRVKINVAIVLFWIIGLLGGFSNYFIPAPFYSFCGSNLTSSLMDPVASYCVRVSCSIYENEYLLFSVVIIMVFVMAFLYLRIYTKLNKLRHVQQVRLIRYSKKQVMGNSHNVCRRRNFRGLVTTQILLLTFVICCLPYCSLHIINNILLSLEWIRWQTALSITLSTDPILYNLLLINCLFNPLIYAMRMKEVRHGYIKAIITLFPCCFTDQHQKIAISHKRRLMTTLSTTSSSGYISNGSVRSFSHKRRNSRWSFSSSSGHARPSSTSTMGPIHTTSTTACLQR